MVSQCIVFVSWDRDEAGVAVVVALQERTWIFTTVVTFCALVDTLENGIEESRPAGVELASGDSKRVPIVSAP